MDVFARSARDMTGRREHLRGTPDSSRGRRGTFARDDIREGGGNVCEGNVASLNSDCSEVTFAGRMF